MSHSTLKRGNMKLVITQLYSSKW